MSFNDSKLCASPLFDMVYAAVAYVCATTQGKVHSIHVYHGVEECLQAVIS